MTQSTHLTLRISKDSTIDAMKMLKVATFFFIQSSLKVANGHINKDLYQRICFLQVCLFFLTQGLTV